MNDMLKTDIRFLKGIGEKRAAGFKKLGITTVEDLLFFFPRAYEDWQNTVPVREAPENETVAIKAIIISRPLPIKTRSGKIMYRTCATDGVGIVDLIFFNNRFVVDDLKENEERTRVREKCCRRNMKKRERVSIFILFINRTPLSHQK